MECVKFKGRDAVRDVKVGGWLDHCYHGNMDINELFLQFSPYKEHVFAAVSDDGTIEVSCKR